MVKYYSTTDGKVAEQELLVASSWINISPPFNIEELEQLSAELEIPLDFLTDSLDIDERSRYEREDDVKLVVLNTPIKSTTTEPNGAFYTTVPIGIVMTPEYILTIASFENPVLNKFLNNQVKNFKTSDFETFVLQLFEQNVFRYLTCLKDLNEKRNLIEQELYDSNRNRELKQLLSIEKSLVYFVTALSSNELLKMKMLRSDFLNIRGQEEKVDFLEGVITDNSQALEMANVYTNILGGTMDAFASIISNNLNHVIKRLTMITIILMVPTLITSLFGMNVVNGLEQHPLGMLFIMVGSTVLTILTILFANSRRWF